MFGDDIFSLSPIMIFCPVVPNHQKGIKHVLMTLNNSSLTSIIELATNINRIIIQVK